MTAAPLDRRWPASMCLAGDARLASGSAVVKYEIGGGGPGQSRTATAFAAVLQTAEIVSMAFHYFVATFRSLWEVEMGIADR